MWGCGDVGMWGCGDDGDGDRIYNNINTQVYCYVLHGNQNDY